MRADSRSEAPSINRTQAVGKTHDLYICHSPELPELPVEVKEWDREPVRALPQLAGLPRKPSRESGR